MCHAESSLKTGDVFYYSSSTEEILTYGNITTRESQERENFFLEIKYVKGGKVGLISTKYRYPISEITTIWGEENYNPDFLSFPGFFINTSDFLK